MSSIVKPATDFEGRSVLRAIPQNYKPTVNFFTSLPRDLTILILKPLPIGALLAFERVSYDCHLLACSVWQVHLRSLGSNRLPNLNAKLNIRHHLLLQRELPVELYLYAIHQQFCVKPRSFKYSGPNSFLHTGCLTNSITTLVCKVAAVTFNVKERPGEVFEISLGSLEVRYRSQDLTTPIYDYTSQIYFRNGKVLQVHEVKWLKRLFPDSNDDPDLPGFDNECPTFEPANAQRANAENYSNFLKSYFDIHFT